MCIELTHHPRTRQAVVEHRKKTVKMQSTIALFFALVIMGASANRIQWARLLAQLQNDLELPVVDQREPKTLASATRANGSSYQAIMQELGMRYMCTVLYSRASLLQ